MAQKQRVGIRGRSSSSRALGTTDPRLSRNVRVHTRGEDDAAPLIRDDFGRRALDLGTSLEVVNGKLAVAVGFQRLAVRTVTDAVSTATLSDDMLRVDATAAAISVILPKASTANGKVYHIKKIDSGPFAMIIDAFGSETIDGAATTPATSTQYDSFMLVCDGTEWWII